MNEPRQMCDGRARPELVFNYIRDVGAMSEKDYPYTKENGECAVDETKIIAKIKGFQELRQNFSVDELKSALYSIGPVINSILIFM